MWLFETNIDYGKFVICQRTIKTQTITMSQNKQTTYDLQCFDPYRSSFTFQTKRFKLLNDTIWELGGMFCYLNYQSFIEKSKCMSIHIHNIVPKFVVVKESSFLRYIYEWITRNEILNVYTNKYFIWQDDCIDKEKFVLHVLFVTYQQI